MIYFSLESGHICSPSTLFRKSLSFFTPAECISKWASYFQVLKVPFWKLTLAPQPRPPAEIGLEADVCWQTRRTFLSEVMCARAVWRASGKPPQSFRHLHYRHNINDRRMQTPHFLLCTIINHRGAFFSPSTLVEGIKKKKKYRNAYLISFSTGSHKRNCQDTFSKVSIKSKSSRSGGALHEWF